MRKEKILNRKFIKQGMPKEVAKAASEWCIQSNYKVYAPNPNYKEDRYGQIISDEYDDPNNLFGI